MARISDGGQHTAHAGRLGALAQEAVLMRDLQVVGIGLEDVVGPEAVNGNEQKRAPANPRRRQNQQENEKKAAFHDAMITPGAGGRCHSN